MASPIKNGEWYLLAVTVRAKRFLGVHIAPMGKNSEAEVLGGYDLGGDVIPIGNAPLVVGVPGTSALSGLVGSFGVLRDIDVAKNASKILKRMARQPMSGPEIVDSASVILWANPVRDLGPLNLPIHVEH